MALSKVQPLILGGIGGASGGAGGPPGGFVGYLPQTRVSYDTTEAALSGTPPSGASLLDNLNHIRYRVSVVEGAVGGLRIEEDDILVASGVTILDFRDGFDLINSGPNEVTIITTPIALSGVTLSGIFNEDLTSQVPGTHFTIANITESGTLRLYYNGLRQDDSNYILDSDRLGFTTTFTTYSGDIINVDYEVLYSGAFVGTHTHSNYYTKVETDLLLLGKLGTGSFTAKGDILVGSGVGVFDAFNVGTDGQFIVADSTEIVGMKWETKYIKQQMVFAIEGANLTIGVKPLRIHAHNNGTVTEIACGLNTAPTTTPVRVDIMKNGVSIFSSPQYVEIPIGQKFASRSIDFSDNTILKDDYFQHEIVQGDSSASDLTTHIRFQWEL